MFFLHILIFVCTLLFLFLLRWRIFAVYPFFYLLFLFFGDYITKFFFCKTIVK
nr:MAG TPA: hypothetical protein [Caudoviricetes sp.]